MGGRRRVVQRIGVGQPLGLGLQVEILAFERLEPLDLFQPVPQVLGFPRPLAGAGDQLIELTSDLQVPLVDPLVVAEQSGELGPANRSSAARCLPGLSSCCWSACPCTATRSSAR